MAANMNLPPGPVSNRALAKLLGLKSDNAVRVALRTGRLSRCKVPGGLDPAIAVEEWTATTDRRQQRVVTALTDAATALDAKRAAKARPRPENARSGGVKPPAPTPAVPAAQDRLAAHVAANRAKGAKPPPPDDVPGEDDPRTVAEIRRGMLVRDDLVAEHRWQVERALWVPREQVLMFAQSLGREFRDATLQLADQYAAQISADLGVDEHACHTVLDRYMRMHFEAVIKVISTDKVLSGEEPEADDLADEPADPDQFDHDEDDA